MHFQSDEFIKEFCLVCNEMKTDDEQILKIIGRSFNKEFNGKCSVFDHLCFQDEEYDSLLGFNMQSYRSCKNLWQSCVEHHAFFRQQSCQRPPPTRRLFHLNGGLGLFHIGSKFRYSGRTVFETMREAELQQREVVRRMKFLDSHSERLF